MPVQDWVHCSLLPYVCCNALSALAGAGEEIHLIDTGAATWGLPR